MKIPQCNPKAAYEAYRETIDDAIRRVLHGGNYILGAEVAAFEREFAAYIGVPHGIGVASGTDAVSLALAGCGIGPGDEVVTASHTAVATVAAIERIGAVPVLADVSPATYTLCPESLERAIGARTRAVVVVHLYGLPAAMTDILRLVRSKRLVLIEDCAQAHGATYEGKRVGSLGDAAAFSFYPTKNLGAFGDGGMVVTRDGPCAERVRALRQYGWRERYVSETPGMNSRLDELHAAMLRVLLPHLDARNDRRRAVAGQYTDALQGLPLILPACPPACGHVYHQYVVRVPSREKLRRALEQKGIGTAVHYPVPVHAQPAYAGRLRCVGTLAATEQIADDILSLPMFPEMTDSDVARVTAAVHECLKMREV